MRRYRVGAAPKRRSISELRAIARERLSKKTGNTKKRKDKRK